MIQSHGLVRHIHDRGGDREIRFLLGVNNPTLPVWWNRQLVLLRWGTRRRQSRVLPVTSWARASTVEAGLWARCQPEEVVIPATLGLDRGVWFHVVEGVRGVVVRDETGLPVVYPLVEPASHYYRIMTRSEWTPALVGEVI
jgi:hypothetical protein